MKSLATSTQLSIMVRNTKRNSYQFLIVRITKQCRHVDIGSVDIGNNYDQLMRSYTFTEQLATHTNSTARSIIQVLKNSHMS